MKQSITIALVLAYAHAAKLNTKSKATNSEDTATAAVKDADAAADDLIYKDEEGNYYDKNGQACD